MRIVYKQTDQGWVKVFTAQSFEHACEVAKRLEAETGIPHCVNS